MLTIRQLNMKVAVENMESALPEDVTKRIIGDVTHALNSIKTKNDQFIVNDTKWYFKNPKGEVKPSVVNRAGFLSSIFQNALEDIGWEKEPTLNGQTFDAQLDLVQTIDVWKLGVAQYLKLLSAMHDEDDDNFGHKATDIYRRYVLSESIYLPRWLEPYRCFFTTTKKPKHIVVGLEFETGNIASSFRAINKLQGLYDLNLIDIGVFITSFSKEDGACRIWPVSNRNGSFEELNMRNYVESRSYTAIDISFRPDSYSNVAPYFNNESTYKLNVTGKVQLEGKEYDIAVTIDNEKKYCPT